MAFIFFCFLLDYCHLQSKCNGHGTCRNDGSCQCHVGYFGDDCSSKLTKAIWNWDSLGPWVPGVPGICRISAHHIWQPRVLCSNWHPELSFIEQTAPGCFVCFKCFFLFLWTIPPTKLEWFIKCFAMWQTYIPNLIII